jgi:hypothetical protein
MELLKDAFSAAERSEPIVCDRDAGAATVQNAPFPLMTTPTVRAMIARSRLSDQLSM